MSRNNLGQGGQPPWRHPEQQDPFSAPPAGQAPNYGYQQAGQGYYFPPQEQAPQPPPFGGGGGPFPPQQATFPPQQQMPYAPPPAQPQHQDWGGQQPDPRGYDLGGYMPPADPQQYAPAPPSQYPQHGYGEPDSEFDEMVEDDEEPRGGRRALMIVAALVGAIGLGGGLAYTYKTYIAPKGGRPPLITQDAGPNKVKPTAPGGKEFAHADKKLFSRLGDEGAQPPPAAASEPQPERVTEDRDAPRKVRVIPISPTEQASAASPPSGPMPLPPGVMLDNMGPGQPPPGAVRAAPPPAMPAPMNQASSGPPPVQAAPIVRAVPPPPVKIVTPAAEEAPPAPPRQMAQAAPPRVAVPRAPAPTPTPTPVSAPQTTGTSGYVAVLSSQKSRMDALKAYADLQLKYGDVLTSRTPDVQEADLSSRGLGTMYRLVVGPPGSRDAAAGVCSQLKTAGYAGCWVMAY